MVKLFLLLSGEHDTLPASEVQAILEAEGFNYEILEALDQVLRIEAPLEIVEAVRRRAAFTRACGVELFTCEADLTNALKALRSINLEEFIGRGESFAVRVRHVKNYAKEISGMFMERKLGEAILHRVKEAKVKLKCPDKTFLGILTGEKLVFGLKVEDIPAKSFIDRRPKNRPFFHPSAMPPKLARGMVNLARAQIGRLIFDPFCGTGSILIEAALVGCRIIGIDVQRRMVMGCQKNLNYFGIKPESLILADACKPPIAAVDCVVTDPPYGRSATTLRRTTAQIINDVLNVLRDLIRTGGHICIAAPKTVGVGRIGRSLGYKHVESHFVYIHRSLTREIAVLER
ncbi:MAG: DNA methyltransferase [Candidatus Bathyarchaeota archaeon]|nr:DNA methyltransferase [Candidatus Bathyarchaeota archaeon]MCX8176939.1 DNA methyltransferase [Candidatus Bathyarchaeota archaeon]MDW8193374.1 DNA methyltransferase [Nitrososphaerota archaeon]